MTEADERVVFEALNQEEVEDLRPKYRSLFGNTDMGQEVLADILVNFCSLGSYLDPENKENIGAYNVGISILSRLGVFSSDMEKKRIVRALLALPVTSVKT